MLNRTRRIHRQSRPQNGENQNQKREYQQLHRKCVRDWRLRMVWLDVHAAQESRHRSASRLLRNCVNQSCSGIAYLAKLVEMKLVRVKLSISPSISLISIKNRKV